MFFGPEVGMKGGKLGDDGGMAGMIMSKFKIAGIEFPAGPEGIAKFNAWKGGLKATDNITLANGQTVPVTAKAAKVEIMQGDLVMNNNIPADIALDVAKKQVYGAKGTAVTVDPGMATKAIKAKAAGGEDGAAKQRFSPRGEVKTGGKPGLGNKG